GSARRSGYLFRLLGRMADRLEGVAVGVDDKGRVVVGVILRAYARPSVVMTAGNKRRAVKGTHGLAVGGAEAHVHPPQRRYARFDRNRELHAKLTGHGTVLRPSALEVHGPDKTKRRQRRVVEPAAALQVAHAE